MADDRPADGEVDAIAKLRAEFDDFKSTTAARVSRRPVGCIEESLVVRADTLALNGQTVSRETYPVLWQWAQDNDLVAAGLFTTGDNSTTFGLPNLSGRVPVGVGTLGADTYTLGQAVGAATRALTAANLPAHKHDVAVAAHTTHNHGVTVDSVGGHIHDTTNGQLDTNGAHGGHFPGSQFSAASGPDLGLAAWNSGGATAGGHGHFFTLDITSGGGHSHTGSSAAAGPTTHSVTETTVGSGTGVDIRQPGIGLHWIIWT